MKVWNKKPWKRNHKNGNVSFQADDIFEIRAGQIINLDLDGSIYKIPITNKMISGMKSMYTPSGVEFYTMPYDINTAVDQYAS